MSQAEDVSNTERWTIEIPEASPFWSRSPVGSEMDRLHSDTLSGRCLAEQVRDAHES